MERISEREVVAWWRAEAARGRQLMTEDGRAVRVVYPGRLNDGRGGDFCDAVIMSRGATLRGGIEVHVRSSDWRAHGHHLDAEYDGVVLHVVHRHDSHEPTRLHNGGTVPVLALEGWMPPEVPPPAVQTPGCFGAGVDAPGETLDLVGDQRFLAKAIELQRRMEAVGPGQTLYRGLLGAMGYAGNTRACLELADRLPLAVLEEATRARTSVGKGLLRVQALLLGTAGLLPFQRGHACVDIDGYIARLERAWTAYTGIRPMPFDDWRLFRVRPQNSPVRRLVAVTYIISRHASTGLVAGLAGRILSGIDYAPALVDEGLAVASEGYWVGHFDFGRTARGLGSSLLGGQRAADVVVNVLLPFVVALGWSDGRAEAAARALEMYRRRPRLATNTLERHMKAQLGIAGRVMNTARRQQGLIHIYRSFCARGWCEHCPLRRGRARPVSSTEGAVPAVAMPV
jgi:hypothetical protein